MSRSSRESHLTQKKILNAAKKEFADKGYSGARMNSIAKRAGVNQALLYYHFENKENLYLSIFRTVMGDDISNITAKIIDEVRSWKETPEMELCAAIYLLVNAHLETHDDELNRIFAREIAEDMGLIHDLARKYMMPRIMLFDNFIQNGIDKGKFEISNSKMFTFSVISFISNYINGEQLVRGTKWHKDLYRNKKETLYNYLLEQSFKILAPTGKILVIPILSGERKAKLDIFINEIINIYTIK